MTEPQQSFTGRARRRVTSKAVKIADRTARTAITFGGIGTILAVGTVCAFLISVVLPLFRSGSIESVGSIDAQAVPVFTAVDEHRVLGWSLDEAGVAHAFRLDNGDALRDVRVFDQPIAVARFSREKPYDLGAFDPAAINEQVGADPDEVRGREAIVALADGRIRYAKFVIATVFFEEDDAPAEVRDLEVDKPGVWRGRVVQLTPRRQIRMKTFFTDVPSPDDAWDDEPASIVSIDCNFANPESATETLVYAAVTDDGHARVVTFGIEADFMGNRALTTYKRRTIELPRSDTPSHVRVSGIGDAVFVAWPDGEMIRLDLYERDDTGRTFDPHVAERVDLVPAEDGRLTAFDLLIGRSTLIVGDSNGGLAAWFRVRDPESETSERTERMTRIRTIAQLSSPISAIAPSGRSRLVGVGCEDGSVHAFHVTSGKSLGTSRVEGGGRIDSMMIAPKEDAIVARSGRRIWRWDFDPGYPEASFSSLLTRVWYEGYPQPEHTWQSTSGSDEGEPKFGLMPLIFGTLKATLYSMLFGVPLALLAAIYTSEYLTPSTRVRVKPVIEMMASLPSVVLGFLAGLVFAPFVEDSAGTVLSLALGIPLTLLIGAYLWQLLPPRKTIRMSRFRIHFISLALLVGIASAWAIGPLAEAFFFSGDLKGWLDGQVGDGASGWAFVLLPFAALGVSILVRNFVSPVLPSSFRTPLAELARFGASILVTLIIAWALGHAVNWAAGDPRGGVLGTYVQRNAMVVGFVMGFAIIPIIYTVAEDALTSVPNHLRSASLGAGATVWQTAVRVVIPTAMSGLFSAVMIGVGRAVGETMIVLMAAGNTPIMEMNIFNGFRTLSANIAVELPEAAKDSTHYRILFLAGLTLFTMTFVLNTVAEVVRSRFRKRAYQL